MYLRTNDAAVARAFAVPDTHFALDYVKPDLILLRVLARGLVMWDEVAATRSWVESQLPEIMKVAGPPSNMPHPLNSLSVAQEHTTDVQINAAAGKPFVFDGNFLVPDILQMSAAQPVKCWKMCIPLEIAA
jgi:anaphase-promoting complex subunit 1